MLEAASSATSRVLEDATATITVTLTVDGEATDPSPATATVALTKADGTVLQAATAATRTDTGVFTYALTTTHTADLGSITATWVSSLGTIRTQVEVVGGFHFSLAELRALYTELSESNGYTAQKIMDVRTLAESFMEDACGTAFVPRGEVGYFSGSTTTLIPLPRKPLRTVAAVTDDGTSVTITDLEVLDGAAYLPAGWTGGVQNLLISYTYGHSQPPPFIKRATMMLAKDWLVRGPVSDRATQYVATEGGDVVNQLTPGFQGALTGIPAVDAAIKMYQRRAATVGSIAMVPESRLLRDADDELLWNEVL